MSQHASAPAPNRVPIAGVAGNVLEWYDFAVFGFLAPIISRLFFPSEDHVAGLIQTFGVFAIGYFVRPLGGMVFGQIGDRYGRKRALLLSVILMAIPTTLVGCLPTYNAVGLFAPLLLMVLRVAQGLSVGGELIGSMSYLVEIAPEGRRGYLGSWSLVSAVAGILIGSLTALLMQTLVSEQAMRAWGWRLPFLAGAFMGVAGAWIRRSMDESPRFIEAKEKGQILKAPLRESIRKVPGQIFQVMLMNMIMGSGLYMLFLWMPTYLEVMLDPPVSNPLLINSLAMFFLLWIMPVAGWASDRVGRRPVLLSGVIGLGVSVYPLFVLIDQGNPWVILASQCVFAVFVGILYGVMPATMGELFPTSVRYSAVGLGYNLAFALFCGTSPLVSTYLIKQTHALTAPAIYLMVLALVSLPAFLRLRPGRGMESKVDEGLLSPHTQKHH